MLAKKVFFSSFRQAKPLKAKLQFFCKKKKSVGVILPLIKCPIDTKHIKNKQLKIIPISPNPLIKPFNSLQKSQNISNQNNIRVRKSPKPQKKIYSKKKRMYQCWLIHESRSVFFGMNIFFTMKKFPIGYSSCSAFAAIGKRSWGFKNYHFNDQILLSF